MDKSTFFWVFVTIESITIMFSMDYICGNMCESYSSLIFFSMHDQGLYPTHESKFPDYSLTLP